MAGEPETTKVCWKSSFLFLHTLYRIIRNRINSFFAYILYFLFLSLIGFGLIKSIKPRTPHPIGDLRLFFTVVSQVTQSGMSVVNMEDFSNRQLVVMTALMLLGSEVFISMVVLYLSKSQSIKARRSEAKVSAADLRNQMEIRAANDLEQRGSDSMDKKNPILRQDSIKFLAYVVLGYLLLIQVLGVAGVSIYLAAIPSAMNVLRTKGIKSFTFALFTVVSTFTNCGLIPTNENMIVFSQNAGLLWILMPQILLGNTLFPPCLRLVVWVLGKRVKKPEAEYLLSDEPKPVYSSLLPRLRTQLLTATVFTLLLTGVVVFCALDWNSSAVSGLNPYQKLVAIVFQTTNTRHAGENVFNLANVSPALLVFFVLIMYLPSYTTYIPIDLRSEEDDKRVRKVNGRKKRLVENLKFSQPCYLAIFIIVLCITERRSMRDDPLNFSLLNIVVEVISSYGNVGYSTGYSCDLRPTPDPTCDSPWYGLSGRFSARGKIAIILVMYFGRLKQFSMRGGQAWDLM